MSEVTGALVLLAAIVAAGVVGSLLIMRHLPGTRALGAFILWLPVPYLVLAAIIGANSDPTLSSSQATYNFQLAFVLASFVITIPWAIANLVGGLIGRRKRRNNPPLPANWASARAPVDPNYPDWSHGDNPSLSLADISELMDEIAGRAGVERQALPSIGAGTGRDDRIIDRDKFDYIYIGIEDGVTKFDHRTVIADHLMYLVFSDAARGLPGERQAFLAGIDPRWGRQFALQHKLAAGG
jgi:hypothetical protein